MVKQEGGDMEGKKGEGRRNRISLWSMNHIEFVKTKWKILNKNLQRWKENNFTNIDEDFKTQFAARNRTTRNKTSKKWAEYRQ